MENVQAVNSASQQNNAGALYKFMRMGMAILAMLLTLLVFIGMAVGIASAAGVSLNAVAITKYVLRMANMGMAVDTFTYVMVISYACVYIAFLIVILVMFIKSIIHFIKYMTKFNKKDSAAAVMCTAAYDSLLREAFTAFKFAVILILLCRMFSSPMNGLAITVLVIGTIAYVLCICLQTLFVDGKFVIAIPSTILVLVKKLLLPVMFVYIIGACVRPVMTGLCDGMFSALGGHMVSFDDSSLFIAYMYHILYKNWLYLTAYIIAISMMSSFLIPLPPAEGKKPANNLKKFIVMLVFFMIMLIADIAIAIMASEGTMGDSVGEAVTTWIGPILVSVAGIVLYAGLKGLNDTVEVPVKAAAPAAAPSVENAEPPAVEEPAPAAEAPAAEPAAEAPADVDEYVKEGEGLPPETEATAAEPAAEAAAPAKVFCSSCGAANDEGSKFCYSCGNKLHD